MWTLGYEFCNISHVLKDSVFLSSSLEAGKSHFQLAGRTNSGDGSDLAHRPSLSGLSSSSAREQAVSRRALTLSETKSEVPKWPVWTDPWIQKTSPPFEKVLTKPGNANSNSFRPLQQPGQGGRAIPILEMGKLRHGAKTLSEEPGASQ